MRKFHMSGKKEETALTDEEFDELTDILLQAESESSLTPWEKNFVTDIKSQADKWGTSVRVSKKQWEILYRIRDK